MQSEEEKKARKAARMKVYFARDPEKWREVRKKRYEANRGSELARSKAWRGVNSGKVAKYEDSRKKEALARLKVWRVENPDFKDRENHRRRARLKGGGDLSVGIREALLLAQKGRCAICGCFSKGWHIDHIVPISKGGTNTDDNVQLTCPHCNLKKGSKM